MGHTRLGTIPTTRKWQAIVSSLAGQSGSLAYDANSHDQFISLANRILATTSDYLQSAVSDDGFIETFYTLVKVVESSRTDNWTEHLRELSINLEHDSSLIDLIAESQQSILDRAFPKGRSTDVAEMCLSAFGQTVSELVSPFSSSLFEENLTSVQSGIRRLSTKDGFSDLGQAFFGNFLSRYVGFYTSRILADVVGNDESSIKDVTDIINFNRDFDRHCLQSAHIVHDFSGEWYSKGKYLETLDRNHTRGFLAIVVKKLRAELKKQVVSQ